MQQAHTGARTGDRIAFDPLVELLTAILVRHGANRHVAGIIARNCAMCERDGCTSHGIFRMAGYVSSLDCGWVDGTAVPVIEDAAPAYCRVDAKNGFAQPALELARKTAVEKARHTGLAAIAIRGSHHLSALWPDVEPFAGDGLIAFSVVNSFRCTVPHGGDSPLFGTNPVAFAVPRQGEEPLVFDMATSAIPNGDVQIAARAGQQLPGGVAVDANGAPTTDPDAVLNGGALLTFGGHKGSALSMMVELLAAGLTGGHFSHEFDWSGHDGAQTPHTGQFVLLIDPQHAGGRPFGDRVETLIKDMRFAGVQRLPADRRYRNRRRAEQQGIHIGVEERARLDALLEG
ncbi:Ldh family oxidoreductase [Roseitalea porphyridii]|uniref:Delta(1)-pyrroline-2-carboxylate/Delta(1)-piperideine-2-carboxylate reductase n=2 Tax=Roseitalea porphyridii TaxID=1852022 RepID=A0A4P6V7V3_9HYPH|nr:Ldh family oxidoreductase [Roseitalea porphyridii]